MTTKEMEEMETINQVDGESQLTMDVEGKPITHEKFYESNAGDGTTVYEQYLHGIPLYSCILSCFASLFLIGLDQTIIMTLLEEVGNKFNAYEKIGWITSGYLLTMAVFAATWGKMSIIFGRKWSLLLAIFLFEAGSLMCALANNMNVLIGGRVLAGVGGGGIQTLVFIVASEIVSIDKRVLIFIMLTFAFAISTVIGPLIGGAFTEHSTWRWCFYMNLPIGGVAAGLFTISFHPPKPKGTLKEKLLLVDYMGTFLLTSGVVLFLLGLTFGGVDFPWRSGAVISTFILGGLLLIAFCIWNFKYSKNPIIPLAIVKVPQIVFPVLSMFLMFLCFMGSVTYLTVYFQIVLGLSPWKTGVRAIPMIISLVGAAIVTGVLMRKTGHIKPFVIFGGVCGCVGYGCLSLFRPDSSNAEKIGLLILPGIYVGMVMQTSLISSQLNSPKDASSMLLTTALVNFARALGGTIGANLSQAIFNSSFKNKIRDLVNSLPNKTLSGFTADQATKLISEPAVISKLSPRNQKLVIDVVMESIKNVFYTLTAVACLSLVTILFYSNKKIPKENEVKKSANDNEEEIAYKDNKVKGSEPQ